MRVSLKNIRNPATRRIWLLNTAAILPCLFVYVCLEASWTVVKDSANTLEALQDIWTGYSEDYYERHRPQAVSGLFAARDSW